MLIKYVGPSPAVEVRGQEFVKGVPVDVPKELAGRPAEKRWAEAVAELVVATTPGDSYSHARAAELRAEIAGLDVGEGLLAQVGIWEAVKGKAAAADKEDDK